MILVSNSIFLWSRNPIKIIVSTYDLVFIAKHTIFKMAASKNYEKYIVVYLDF